MLSFGLKRKFACGGQTVQKMLREKPASKPQLCSNATRENGSLKLM